MEWIGSVEIVSKSRCDGCTSISPRQSLSAFCQPRFALFARLFPALQVRVSCKIIRIQHFLHYSYSTCTENNNILPNCSLPCIIWRKSSCLIHSLNVDEYCPVGWSVLRRGDGSAHTCDPMAFNAKCPRPHNCVHSKCGISFCCVHSGKLFYETPSKSHIAWIQIN